ncbi:MAG: MFS transporter [Planctomycetes bacterium]|nr:MFS transporter [Planctomycetota bacterium]
MASEPQPATFPNDERPTKVRWLIFSLACGTSFVLYLHRYTWGLAKRDVAEEFGWSEWQLGFLDSAFSASYGFGQIPSGILCDWFGPHVLLGTIIIFWSLSMGGVALASGFASMLIARVVFGLTQAGCYPTLSKVSKLWFPLSVRTSVQGWIATFFGRGGGAVSFVLFGTVLIGWMGLTWRQAIVVLTVLGGLFGVLFIVLFRNTPKDHPWANEAEETLIVEGNPDVSQATHSKLKWSLVLKSRNMKFFFVQQFTSAFADNVYVYWIPLFLLTAKGVDMKQAGWMAAIPLVGGAVGGMIGGILQSYFIIRTGNRRWSRSWIGLIGKLLATVFIFVSLAFNDAVQIVSVFFVVKFFSDWSQPTVWGTITDIAGRNSASVFGCINTVGSIAGFIAGPTMGLTIMMFSETHSISEESTTVAKIERVEERSTFKTVLEPLEYMNVAKGTLTGSIFSGESAIYSFEVSKSGEFSFTSLGESVAKPIESRCRLNRVKATVTMEWDESPGNDVHLVVGYDYIDYTNGWNTLFFALGVIYLISALCWLFIDCTKTLEDEVS